MTCIEIHDGLFGVNYVLCYNIKSETDNQKLKKILSDRYKYSVVFQPLSEDENGLCQSLETKDGSPLILILLRSFKRNGYWYGALCHECFHATEYAFESRGIKYNKHTKEVFAYNIHMLINNFFDKTLALKIKKHIKI